MFKRLRLGELMTPGSAISLPWASACSGGSAQNHCGGQYILHAGSRFAAPKQRKVAFDDPGGKCIAPAHRISLLLLT